MSKCLFEQNVLPIFEESRGAWLKRARKIALELGRTQQEVTINDVRERIPPPMGCDPRVMGAVFLRSDGWRLIRHERSDRKRCHNRPVGVFTLDSSMP